MDEQFLQIMNRSVRLVADGKDLQGEWGPRAEANVGAFLSQGEQGGWLYRRIFQKLNVERGGFLDDRSDTEVPSRGRDRT